MAGITPAQIRKIYAVCRERGVDSDLLHEHIAALTGRESIRAMTVMEAVRVIDSLSGRNRAQMPDGATARQRHYIDGLMRTLGWVDGDGNPETGRLDGMCRKYCNLDSHKWMTKRNASDIIEALKNMVKNMELPC